MNRAVCLLNAGLLDEAIEAFSQAGRLQQRTGSIGGGRTVAELRAQVAQDAECADVHYQLGIQLAAAGEYQEAELRYTQAVCIARDHAGAWVGLGLCAAYRGRTEEAALHFRRAQGLRSGGPHLGLMLAAAFKSAKADVRGAVRYVEVESDEGCAEEPRGR